MCIRRYFIILYYNHWIVIIFSSFFFFYHLNGNGSRGTYFNPKCRERRCNFFFIFWSWLTWALLPDFSLTFFLCFQTNLPFTQHCGGQCIIGTCLSDLYDVNRLWQGANLNCCEDCPFISKTVFCGGIESLIVRRSFTMRGKQNKKLWIVSCTVKKKIEEEYNRFGFFPSKIVSSFYISMILNKMIPIGR